MAGPYSLAAELGRSPRRSGRTCARRSPRAEIDRYSRWHLTDDERDQVLHHFIRETYTVVVDGHTRSAAPRYGRTSQEGTVRASLLSP